MSTITIGVDWAKSVFSVCAVHSKHLPYPKASARAGRGSMQRHLPWSIASTRFRLARVIARHLSRCPRCGGACRSSQHV